MVHSTHRIWKTGNAFIMDTLDGREYNNRKRSVGCSPSWVVVRNCHWYCRLFLSADYSCPCQLHWILTLRYSCYSLKPHASKFSCSFQGWVERSPSTVLDTKAKEGLESLVILLKCLKIMENATFLSKDNQVNRT